MPTISEFYGMLIQMYWNDHAPPHFHVRYSDFKATVSIERARDHQVELQEDWRLCELRQHPLQITPLP